MICGFGRLGTWFGSERLDIQPDLLTFAKGLTSAYFAMGGVLMHDRVAKPLLGEGEMFMHGITFGGHPVGSAVALKNLEIIEREGLLANVMNNEPWLSEQLHGCARCRSLAMFAAWGTSGRSSSSPTRRRRRCSPRK